MVEVNNLSNSMPYNTWRKKKLANYPKSLNSIVRIKDPLQLSEKEKLKIIKQCEIANFAIYASDKKIDVGEMLQFARQFNLACPDSPIFSGEDGVAEITRVVDGRQREYVPYSNRPLSWHTDGYYNPWGSEVCAFILHCDSKAGAGGETALLDPEIAYIKLRDKDPEFIEAFMQTDALEIPANIENGKVVRPSQLGPVFSFINCKLHMRYSGRKRFVNWKKDSTLLKARIFLNQVLEDINGPVLRYTLEPGEGVICNNVLHKRSAFEDGADLSRRLFRARFPARVADSIEF